MNGSEEQPVELRPALGWYVAGFTALLVFAASPMLLAYIGLPYTDEDGFAAFRLHPTTYLVTIILLGVFCSPKRQRVVQAIATTSWELCAYLIILGVIIFVQVIGKNDGQISNYIDTYILPAGLLFLSSLLNEKGRARIFVVICTFMALNSAVGIFEILSGERLLPFIVHGFLITYDRRATALLGHPLNNALITATMLVLCYGAITSPIWRRVMIALLGASLLAFAGRASTVMAVFGIGLVTVVGGVHVVASGRLSSGKLISSIFVLLVSVPAVLFVVSETNLAEEFIRRWQWDPSAQARFVALEAFALVSANDWLFGLEVEGIRDINIRLDLDFGIENFWIVMLLRLGVIFFPVYCVALLFLFKYTLRTAPCSFYVAAGVFLAGASSNISIGSKSLLLAQFVVLITTAVAYRRQNEPSALRGVPRLLRSSEPAFANAQG